MAIVSGVNIPDNKRVETALTLFMVSGHFRLKNFGEIGSF
ncbi:MAG: hypothetical protein CM1200mP3_07020 [Chloroflexota bacterium]|nr:MAG: hypothetical protein CM1200mP3_07020 [Chloroflexota bacterium]